MQPLALLREPRHESRETPACVARRSEWLLGLFRRYARRYTARSLHAVRLSRSGPVPSAIEGPLIVILNHPSWWDPLIGLILSGSWPERRHYAPIESNAL